MKQKLYFLIAALFLVIMPNMSSAQEKAWHSGPYQHREGEKQMIFADVGWKWGVNLSVSVFIDLDDMMKASPDGQAGWVTVWINGSVGVGVSALPGSVGYAISNEFGDDGFNDPQVGGVSVSGTFGLTSLSTSDVTTDYTVDVSTDPGVTVSMGTTLLAVEMTKSEIFELIKNAESTDDKFAILADHILSRFGQISMSYASGGITSGVVAVITDMRDPHWNGDDWDQSSAMMTAYEVQLKEVHETIRNLQYGGESVVSSIDESARYAVVNQKALQHGAPMEGKKKYHFFTDRYWSNECYFKLTDFAQGTHVKIHACVIDEENIEVDLRANYKHTITYGEDQTDVSVIASLDFVTIDDKPIHVIVSPESGGLHHGWIMFEDVTYNSSKAGEKDEYVYHKGEYVKKSEIQYPDPVPVPEGIVLGAELKPVPTKPDDKFEYKEEPKTSVPSNVWLGKDVGWFIWSSSSGWAYIEGETDHFVKGETYDYTNSDFYTGAGNGPVLATVLYKHGMSHNNTTATFKWYKPGASTPFYTGTDNHYRYWGYVGWGLYIYDDGGAGWFPEGEYKCEIYLGSSLKKTVLFDVYDPGPEDGRFTFIDPTPEDGATISGNWNNGQFNITTGVDGFLGGSNELTFFINEEEHDILPVHSPITNESEFIGSSVWNVKGLADGDYTIRAEITSSMGRLSTEERTITVNNTPPASCSITSPTGGTITSPYTTVEVDASANTDYVQFLVDGEVRGYDTEAPFSKEIYLVNDDATAELTAIAHNIAGNLTSSVRTVNLRFVYISSPLDGADLPNDATIDIEAKTVGTAPSSVEFYVNETLEFTDYSSPYIYTWTTPGIGYSGSYTLKTVAEYSSFTNTEHQIDVILSDQHSHYWEQGPDLINSKTKGSACVTMNGYIYLLSGTDGVDWNNTAIQRGRIGPEGSILEWEILSQRLSGPKIYSCAVHTEDFIYVMGGTSGLMNTMRIPVYADGSVGESIIGDGLPTVGNATEAVIYNDVVYVACGSTIKYSFIQDDGFMSAWTNASSLNENREDFAMVEERGYLYVIGGSINGVVSNTIERAKINEDGSLSNWTTLPTLFVGHIYRHKGVANSNFIYIVGGAMDGYYNRETQRAYVYEDGSLSPWVNNSWIWNLRVYHSIATNEGLNNVIYIAGGTPAENSSEYFKTANGPTISDVITDELTSTTATIEWNTNIPTNSRVDYWLSSNYPDYFSTPVINTSPMVTSHSVTITENLLNDSLYYYRVVSTNDNGNTTMDGCYEFTMPAENAAPTATASATPTSGAVPLEVSFTGSGTDTDGTIASYYWIFGDGNTSDEQNPTHEYTTLGEYNAVLTVTDNNGATGTDVVTIFAGLPIAQYHMDEGEGDIAYDATVNNNDGTINGATWTDGKIGSALSFDGDGDYVDAGDKADFEFSADFSVEAWVKHTTPNNQVYVSKWDGNTGASSNWWLGFYFTDEVFFGVNTENGAKATLSGIDIADGLWHHVAGVRNGTTVSIYIDGAFANSETGYSGTTGDNAAPLTIGNYNGSSGGWDYNGKIDEVAIYDRALTADEIAEHAGIIITAPTAVNPGHPSNITDDIYTVEATYYGNADNMDFFINDVSIGTDNTGNPYTAQFGLSGYIHDTGAGPDAIEIKAVAYVGGNPVAEQAVNAEIWLYGDANGNGSVTMGDALLIRNHCMDGLALTAPWQVGDVNGDGNTTMGDALLTRNHCMDGLALTAGKYYIEVVDGGGSKGTTDTGGEETITDIPLVEETGHLLVYPNPMSGELAIEYDVQSAGIVTINIYDIIGRLVQTLTDEQKPAGQYSVQWNANDTKGTEMPNGTYFIRMQSGNNTQTTKVILMR